MSAVELSGKRISRCLWFHGISGSAHENTFPQKPSQKNILIVNIVSLSK